MSKHRLDLLFDTIKPTLDVCIYPISHQTNMMLSFLLESTSSYQMIVIKKDFLMMMDFTYLLALHFILCR